MNMFAVEFVGVDMHWICQELKLDLLSSNIIYMDLQNIIYLESRIQILV